MQKCALGVVGFAIVIGLAWRASGQQDLVPPGFDGGRAEPHPFGSLQPTPDTFSDAPAPGGDFLDAASEPFSNDPHSGPKRLLKDLQSRIVDELSPEEVQQAIAEAQRTLKLRASQRKFEQARGLLSEVIRESPDSDIGRRAQRALNASNRNDTPDVDSEASDGFERPVPEYTDPPTSGGGPIPSFDSNGDGFGES